MSTRIAIVALLVMSAAAMAQVTPPIRRGPAPNEGLPLPVVSQPATSEPATASTSQPSTRSTTQAAIEQAQLASALTVLKENKISDQADDLRQYLADLVSTAEQVRRADELIRQLGSDDWRTREQATQDLMKLPVLPADALRKAALDGDPEVQTRANEILQKCEGKRPLILGAAFSVIAIRRPDGFTQPLIHALPCCSQDDNLLRQAIDALAAVSKPADAAALGKLLGDKDPLLRRAAVNALAAAIGKSAEDDILKMLQDADEKVQLDAAISVAGMGNRKSLAALLKLMNSQDVAVRSYSFQALGAVTGKNLSFAPYDGLEDRAKSLAVWKEFLDKEGDTIVLRLPIRMGDEDSFLLGNTLIATGNLGQVLEQDPTGREVWTYKGARAVWSAEKLRNGNYLLACFNDSKIIEVTPGGDVAWEYPCPGQPMRAKQLANGNYLIACGGTGRLLEVDRQKKIVWEYKTSSSCCDASRLPNGNTVIACCSAGVREVNPEGVTVWQVAGDAHSVQHLPNGNTLVAFYGRSIVEELDGQQKVVWSFKTQNPCDVYRLRNGNTLITGNQKAVEVTTDGKEVWTRDKFQNGTVRK